MIVCNGFPRSGTNALINVIKALGFEYNEGYNILKRSYINKMTFNYNKNNTIVDFEKEKNNIWHAHLCYSHDTINLSRNNRFINIFRHPKDVLISSVKYKLSRPINEHDVIKFLEKPSKDNNNWIDYYRIFLGWKNEKHILNIKYENLFEEEIIKKISNYLECTYDYSTVLSMKNTNRFINEKGHGTYTGNISNWTNNWSYNIEKKFNDLGGKEIIKELEY